MAWYKLMRVVGESMTPTLRAGKLVVVRTRTYRARSPQRGDIVAARPAALDGRAVVKRIVGVPHDMIQRDGRQWHLRDDEFFLAGDHPADSLDSRQFGPVTREDLVGPVRVRLWLPSRRAC